MPELNRSHLLKFLSKPRRVRDVTEHFGVSAKLAKYHLKEALTSGDILVSQGALPRMSARFHDRGNQNGALYISRKSPLLVGGSLRMRVQGVGKNSTSNADLVHVEFLSKARGLDEKQLLRSKEWALLSETTSTRVKSERGLPFKCGRSFLNGLISRTRLARRRPRSQLLRRETPSDRSEHKMLSQIEKLRLFQALSNQPLPFLDIRGRFGVSSRTIKGLVKKGFLEEEWGPRDIGVRFGLTEKGRSYLEELEVAARIEPKRRESMFIRLKHRIFS
jgi:DNA-binding MarR family transcriptional regulator